MSSSVDNRVVAMKFDNAAFETNVAQTMSTLDKLKAALKFDGGTKGIADVEQAAKRMDFSPAGAAVDALSARFVAMSTVAITALANVTNRVIDMGIQMGKSLSLDQVLSGFSEYETNMNSIQTILANTKSDGSTLDDVNKSLDELNQYADQTIYNFSEMTRNIGTFTAAGVDLETSTQSIKGIANLAAISGSNSQQASTAMYQLSQAIAAGSVKLMDWNSVVNAGMGGEVFQKALFETGKQMKTLSGVDMSTSFEEWTKAGNTFRGSLESGWITADVLTTTLQGFTGDLTEAQIMALGYTKEQTAQILEMGQTGKDAATKVKTLTQLFGTMKEAVGSGWAQSFKILIGDFEEAKSVFSGFAGFFGDIISNSANARNEILQGWKNVGGRDILVQGLLHAIEAVTTAIRPIKEAFQEIFPPITAERLVYITVAFRDLMEHLTMSQGTWNMMKQIFKGFFAAIEIGWTIVKEFGITIKELFGGIVSGAGSEALGFLSLFGQRITKLNEVLVNGGGIAKFFDQIRDAILKFIDSVKNSDAIQKVSDIIAKVKTSLSGFFDDFDFGKASVVTDAADRINERFGWLAGSTDILSSAWKRFVDTLSQIGDKLSEFGTIAKEKLVDIWQRIGDSMGDADFSGILDGVNTGLLGGLLLVFSRFLKNGLQLDFGGGLLENVTNAFEGLTDTLGAMQANLRAGTLLKIAQAVGILTVSVVALSLIDSAALTKAMTALAVGFGQLVAAMGLLLKLGGVGVKLGILTGSMIALSLAVLGLSLAVKVLSTLSWEELAKGLIAVAAVIGIIVIAAHNLTDVSDGMIQAGVGMIAMAIGINIIAIAVKQFAGMSWEEMGKGLLGVAVSLAAITIAMKNMPDSLSMIKTGLGVIGLAVAMNILALAVRQFASMDLLEMGKGLLGLGAALAIIIIAVNAVKYDDMIQTGFGLLLISGALFIVAKAVESLGSMSWGDLIKGIVGIGAVMLILAIGANAMIEALPGAAAMVVVSAAMWVLAEVLEKIGSMSWGDLAKGLVAIVVSMVAFALVSVVLAEAIPFIFALGVSLLVVAAAFAVFGVAAYLFASAFAILVEAGQAGIGVLGSILDTIIERIPEAMAAFGKGIVNAVTTILEATPELVDGLVKLIGALLDGLTELIPKAADTIATLIVEILRLLKEHGPDIIQAGWDLLVTLLQGIEEHIEEVTTLVMSILTKFLNTLAENIQPLIDAGADLLVNLLTGISNNIDDVGTAAGDIITEFITTIGEQLERIITAGADFIIKIIEGIGRESGRIVTAAVGTIIAFVTTLKFNLFRLIQAGWDFIISLINGLTDSIDKNYKDLEDAGARLANAIIDAFKGTLKRAAGGIAREMLAPFKGAWDSVLEFFEVKSPSKKFVRLAGFLVEGFSIGIDRNADKAINSADAFGTNVVSTLNASFAQVVDSLGDFSEFQPTITPVLDLSNVTRDARALEGIMSVSGINPSTSYSQATSLISAIEASAAESTAASSTDSGPRDVTMIQNNYSPKALPVAEIHRGTKSLLEITKEELGV